jgi:NADPH:quinone reductase-like Zn-dependent oxidoreductase
MTRVVRFHEVGGPEVLKFEDMTIGEPGPGEMRIRIQAIGLNRAEAAFRAGRYIEKAILPARLGYEAAGVVEAMGEGVTGFAVGEAVCVIPEFSMNRYGVYAEAAIVPAAAVVKRPAGLSAEQAAAVWMAYLTAYGALIDIAHVGRHDAVVITAASSSVGLAAIQIANSVGALSIAATRTDDKRTGLLAAGAAHVVATERQDLAAEVMHRTDGRGARIVFDPVSGPGIVKLAGALGPQGVLVLYGNLSGEGHQTPFPFGPAVSKGLSLRGYLVFEIIHDPARLARADAFIREGLLKETLKPTIAKTFAFHQIVEAHRYLESNQQLGKVVVTL